MHTFQGEMFDYEPKNLLNCIDNKIESKSKDLIKNVSTPHLRSNFFEGLIYNI